MKSDLLNYIISILYCSCPPVRLLPGTQHSVIVTAGILVVFLSGSVSQAQCVSGTPSSLMTAYRLLVVSLREVEEVFIDI